MAQDKSFIKNFGAVDKRLKDISRVFDFTHLEELVLLGSNIKEYHIPKMLLMASLRRLIFYFYGYSPLEGLADEYKCTSLEVLMTNNLFIVQNVLHHDIGKLKVLDVKGLRGQLEAPSNVDSCKSLEILDVSYCKKLLPKGKPFNFTFKKKFLTFFFLRETEWIESLPKLKEIRAASSSLPIDSLKTSATIICSSISDWHESKAKEYSGPPITYFEPSYLTEALAHEAGREMWLNMKQISSLSKKFVFRTDLPLYPPPSHLTGSSRERGTLEEVIYEHPFSLLKRLVEEFRFPVDYDDLRCAVLKGDYERAKYLLDCINSQREEQPETLIAINDIEQLVSEHNLTLQQFLGKPKKKHILGFNFLNGAKEWMKMAEKMEEKKELSYFYSGLLYRFETDYMPENVGEGEKSPKTNEDDCFDILKYLISEGVDPNYADIVHIILNFQNEEFATKMLHFFERECPLEHRLRLIGGPNMHKRTAIVRCWRVGHFKAAETVVRILEKRREEFQANESEHKTEIEENMAEKKEEEMKIQAIGASRETLFFDAVKRLIEESRYIKAEFVAKIMEQVGEDIIRKLVDYKSEKGMSLLLAFSKCSDIGIIKKLIELGCDCKHTDNDGGGLTYHCLDFFTGEHFFDENNSHDDEEEHQAEDSRENIFRQLKERFLFLKEITSPQAVIDDICLSMEDGAHVPGLLNAFSEVFDINSKDSNGDTLFHSHFRSNLEISKTSTFFFPQFQPFLSLNYFLFFKRCQELLALGEENAFFH